jgi:hypothetical protein
MTYMAKVVDGIVVAVHSRTPEYNATQPDASQFIQTSYNVRGGVYYSTTTGLPVENQLEAIAEQDGRQRKNYAGIGYTYDQELDAFIPPKPYASWILNEDTALWEAPIPYPTDGEFYTWNEEDLSWDLIENRV